MRPITRFVTPLIATAILATPTFAAEPDWNQVGQALGKSGSVQAGGVYRVGFPRTDLKVSLDGLALRPGFALGGWVAFQPMGAEAMVMGDLVLTQDEVAPVMRKLEEGGIEITALHSHMLDEQPRVFFMHFWANDDARKLATGLRAALDKVDVKKDAATAR